MAGFMKPTTTPTPDALFDVWLSRLTGAEMRVLLYAVRRTLGFHKEGDAISRGQFLHGITRADGRVLDAGTGIKSPNTLTAAIARLEGKGLLLKERRKDDEQRDEASYFRLHIVESPTTIAAYGFKPVNTTPVPDELFDYWLARLTDSELFVLLYIIRRTLGFRKNADAIAVRQFIDGVTTRDGRVLDGGCGVRSFKYLYLALHGLEHKGLIAPEQRIHHRRGSLHTLYRLVFEGDLPFVLSEVRSDPRALPVDNAGVRTSAAPTVRGPSIGDDPRAQLVQREGAISIDPSGQLVQNGGAIVADPGAQSVQSEASAGAYPRSSLNAGGAIERLHTQEAAMQQTGKQETAQHSTESQDDSISKASNGTATHAFGSTGTATKPRPVYSPLVSQQASDLSLLFHDQDHQRSNRTRALRLWAESSLDEQSFAEMMHEARLIAMKRGNIEKDAAEGTGTYAGTKNRMPYFFAVLEDLIGMANNGGAVSAQQRRPPAPAQQAPPRRTIDYSSGKYGVCPRCGAWPCQCDAPPPGSPFVGSEGDAVR